MADLLGFVEVSGYSAKDIQDAVDRGYQDCIDDLTTLTATETKTYTASEEGVVGWKTVEVEAQADLVHKVITQNGEFDAEEEGHDGYSSVTVSVPGGGGGGPFTVRFFADDRQTILKTDATVPYGGSASCTALDGTIVNGEYFKGWNPSPTNVKENMNCYPLRGDYQLDPNEIQDTWETICADGGAHYPLGSYKALILDIPATTNDILAYWHGWYGGSEYLFRTRKSENVNTLYTCTFHMVKVAEGEDGSHSTWLSTGCINMNNGGYSIEMCVDEEQDHWVGRAAWRSFKESIGHNVGTGSSHIFGDFNHDWGDSRLRSFLNGFFFNNLPACLKDTIKNVNKAYWGLSSNILWSGSRVQKTSLDKIWMPSVKEFDSLLQTYSIEEHIIPSSFSDLKESSGIDYSAIYAPTYPSASNPFSFITRTVCFTTSNNLYPLIMPSAGDSKIYYFDAGSELVGDGNNSIPFGFCL